MAGPPSSSSSSLTFKLSAQKSVAHVASTMPTAPPSAKQSCPSASTAKTLIDLARTVKEGHELFKLAGKSVGVSRRAVGAARQVGRLWQTPSLQQLKFVYGRGLTLSTANVLHEVKGAGVAGALSGAAALLENAGKFKSGEISGKTYAGRVAYEAGKGIVGHFAGAAAAPLGAAVGAAFPPAGGALAGSAIGYQIGKIVGGSKGAKIGAAGGAVLGALAGTVALAIPGGGQAFGAAAGALGAHMWASEGAGALMDGAAHGIKKLFHW